ncbi:hypothetical protein [Hyphomicrobium facile]|uniref:Uncharacterized protein n=1 Tax=Hyphomicrobium facile TaxID=51670 RepID=A0A1I7NQW4_9HYPH|nr:hypothetical protein [Hyphomicrobium facile]SFV36978.1 hypothetical protein SAMN04488557_2931 [Hyphomicrobium facile]
MSASKSKISGSHLNIAALVATNVAFAYIAWDLWSRPIDISADLDGAAAGEKTIADADATAIAPPPRPGNLSETTTRPIFNASRRPVEAKKVAVADATPVPAAATVAPEQLLLVGILHIGVGDDRALIREASDDLGSWMLIGDSIQGWRVRTISSEMAVIESEGKQYELRISYDARSSDIKAAALNR